MMSKIELIGTEYVPASVWEIFYRLSSRLCEMFDIPAWKYIDLFIFHLRDLERLSRNWFKS